MSESDVHRRQILTSKVRPRAGMVKILARQVECMVALVFARSRLEYWGRNIKNRDPLLSRRVHFIYIILF